MKKLICLFSLFFLISTNFSLVSCSDHDRFEQFYKKINTITALRLLFEDLQLIHDDDFKLKISNTDKFDFNDEKYLSKTFLNEQKKDKNEFAFHFLTNFLKLKPDKQRKFDLSDVILKVNSITYHEVETKVDTNSNEKNIFFTKGLIKLVFENKTLNKTIESFYVPVKDIKIDIFNKIFNNKDSDQAFNSNNDNTCFNIETDLEVSGFEIGKTLSDVKVKFSQDSQLVKNLQNIFENLYHFKLDDLIKFNVKLNRNKSNIDSSVNDNKLKTRILKAGDFIDIELTLSFPKGEINQKLKKQTLQPVFSKILSKKI